MVDFPVLPTRIQKLTSPDYKATSNSWKSGYTLFKRTQFTGVNTRLLLEFSMLSQTELDQIISLWNSTEGVKTFTLSNDFFKDYPSAYKVAIDNLRSTTNWIMESEPIVNPRIICNSNFVFRDNRYDLSITIASQIA